MKILSFLLFFLLAFTSAEATIWRVNNTLSVPEQVDFNELLDAVNSNSVAGGDTIYVEGSINPYEGGILLFKPLVIIGPGIFKSQENLQPVACDNLPAIIGGNPGITLYSGASGTVITGMSIINTFSSGDGVYLIDAHNITLRRNHLESVEISPGMTTDYNTCSDIIIQKNVICGNIYFNANSSSSNISILNNLIVGDISYNGNAVSSILFSNVVAFNNMIDGTIKLKGANIQYNYAEYIRDPDLNSVISNNYLQIVHSINQEVVDSDPSNVINQYQYADFISCENDNWELLPQYITTTHGAYNGSNPYYDTDDPISPANLPAIPVIYECDVPPVGDQTITISVSVRGNN